MRTITVLLALLAGFLPALHRTAHAQNPWADEVVHYHAPDAQAGFDDPQRALGPPRGGGPNVPNNSGVVSLGSQGGTITLRFHEPVEDHPDNPMGLDFIVYGNALWVGGNPQRRFQEAAIIEISEDVNGNGLPDDPWYLIPGSRGYSYEPFPWVTEPPGTDNEPPNEFVLAGNVRNPNVFDGDPATDHLEYNWGYADMSPTAEPYLDNYLRPDNPFTVGIDPGTGGGDAFDIAWAVDADGNPAGITRFHFIRVTSFIDRDMLQLGMASPEIDAVVRVAPDLDTDGDGILDVYEIQVAGTDPLRPESTVLPLEIPALEGGSPEGTLLGSVEDGRGTTLRLYAASRRTDQDREYNVSVDLLAPEVPEGALPGDYIPGAFALEFVASEADFEAAGIQPAELSIRYASAAIAGLDEQELTVFRHDDGGFTQAGMSDFSLNASANLVSFRTRYPGTFVLASTPGEGDEGGEGPRGDITLTTDPPDEMVADPANTVLVTSGIIEDQEGGPVPDGTLATVDATAGAMLDEDVAADLPGVQVATVSGTAAFSVQAPSRVGTAIFSITTVEGSAYGETSYDFVPGPPAGGVEWSLIEAEGTAPVTAGLATVFSTVRDQFGNVVRDGTLLTLEAEGATLLADADESMPGHQVIVNGGRATVFLEAPSRTAEFTLRVYADPEMQRLIREDIFAIEGQPALPLSGTVAVAACLLAAGLLALRGGMLRRGRSA